MQNSDNHRDYHSNRSLRQHGFLFWRKDSGKSGYWNYILIVAVLLIIAVFQLLKEKSGTLKLDAGAFAIKDTSAVTSVKFSDGKEMILLERSGSTWRVNQQFNVKPAMIKALLGLLSEFEISAPVAKSMKNAVLKSFKKNAVTVVIESYSKVLKAYQITDNDSLKVGTFMMLRNDNEPYLIHVPGFDGRISKLFPCDLQLWRDKVIFRYGPADIQSIEVDYPANPGESFRYEFLGFNDIEIQSLKGDKKIKISKNAARVYLMNFTSVPYEKPVESRAKEIFDSLRTQKPYCQIEVKNAVNQLNILKAYRISVGSGSGEFDLNRMYAVHQNDTLPLFIKYVEFDPIMKEFSDFSGR
ncbi:MAG TPA: hypothetical protein VIH57_21820 [Bacteroidales bacterium]